MSRELLAFLLSELRTVRILCRGSKNGKRCSGVVELDVSDLPSVFRHLGACPLCGESFAVLIASTDGVAQDGFTPLSRAIQNLNAESSRFEIEFVLPKKE